MYGIESLLTGHTLADRYRVDEVIGRGGMGAVYRATDERLGRAVALKVISTAVTDAAAHARLRARFHREARAAAALHHPNVVTAYDFGTDPRLEIDFLVMELLRGEDLASRLLRAGPPTPSETFDILCQAARGLAAGHRVGLIHRDVKPGNLHLATDDDGASRVRVLDFGIAEITADEQTVTQLTAFGRSPFSPAYASPEQLRGETCLTRATDVFSLGAVGHHLLTGERAFGSTDPIRMAAELADAVSALPQRIPFVSRSVQAVLRRALAVDPDKRYPHAGAFADALGAALSPASHEPVAQPDAVRWVGQPAAASPEPRKPRFSLFTRKHSPTDATRAVLDPQGPAAPPPSSTSPLQVRAYPLPAKPLPGAPVSPRVRGWFRRTASAVWNFCVTAAVATLFVGSWLLALSGLDAGDGAAVGLGVAAAVLFAPLTVQRILGKRGSYRLSLLGSLVATVGAVFLIGPTGDLHLLLVTIFGLQLLTTLLLRRLGERRSEPALQPQHTPGG